MSRALAGALSAAWLLAVSLVPAWSLDVRPGVPEGDIEVLLDITAEAVLDPANEFTFIDMVPFNDGTGRQAVSTVQGTIRVIDGTGSLIGTPLLTKAQSGLFLPQEAGMTGIAFHPDFNNSGSFGFGKLYTITTERGQNNGGLPDSNVDYPFSNGSNNEEHQDVIREWDLSAFGSVPGNATNNAFSGTLANSREILRIDQPGPFHNVADLAFNTHAAPTDADYGMLYITSGDGGDRTGYSRTASAQNLGTIYGNVLRIDPDPAAHALVRTGANSGVPAYSIPDDNPYNGDNPTETKTSSTLAEIWAHGFRSPWRATFDRDTGDLYIGDVGENLWEEISRVEPGQNYGWALVEGTHDGTLVPGDGTLTPGLTPPIIELPHSDARSITGGFVYRGNAIPELQGKYVFGDLGQGFNFSALFYAIVEPDDPDGDVGDVFEFKLHPDSPVFESSQSLPERLFSIGEDQDGEIYLIGGPDPRGPFVFTRPSVVVKLLPSPGDPPILGDLNGDGLITVDDWAEFKANQGADFSGKTPLQAQMMGDLDGDFDHDLSDFLVFRDIFNDANGAGAFQGLFGNVPEPTSFGLAFLGCALGFIWIARRVRLGN